MAKAEPDVANLASGRTAADVAKRHDPDAYTKSLARRADETLPFEIAAMPPGLPVMLDTNFYLRRLQGKLAVDVAAFVTSRRILHSGIACSELAISAGILDPAHPSTAQNRAAVMGLLDAISVSDIVTPSPEAWTEAGILSGILARTQYLAKPKKTLTTDQACCQEGLRRKLINDVLIFLSAYEEAAILLTANSKDMDLLLRFKPDANVLMFK